MDGWMHAYIDELMNEKIWLHESIFFFIKVLKYKKKKIYFAILKKNTNRAHTYVMTEYPHMNQ